MIKKCSGTGEEVAAILPGSTFFVICTRGVVVEVNHIQKLGQRVSTTLDWEGDEGVHGGGAGEGAEGVPPHRRRSSHTLTSTRHTKSSTLLLWAIFDLGRREWWARHI